MWAKFLEFLNMQAPVVAATGFLISIVTLVLTELNRRQIRRDEGKKALWEANRLVQELRRPGISAKPIDYVALRTAQMNARRALALTRNAPTAQAMMAMCHWLDGGKANAEQDLQRLAKARPKMHSAYCCLASLYLEDGQLDAAEAALRSALETDPTCHVARSGQAILKFKRSLFDEAAELWRAELSTRPHDGVVHANLGAALADGGHHEDALTHLSLALQHGFREADVYRNLGRVLVRMDNQERAERMFQLALEMLPLDLFSIQVLGWMRIYQRDTAGAKEYFERGLAIDPTDKECFEGLQAAARSAAVHAGSHASKNVTSARKRQ